MPNSTTPAERKDEKKRQGKASRIEHDRRIEEVRIMTLSGMTNSAIVQYVTEKYEIKERQAWNYVAKVRKKIQEFVDENIAGMFAEHIAVRRDMRLRARKAGDHHLELQIAQDEAKLWGLYAPTKTEITIYDDLARALRCTPAEAQAIATRVARGEITIADVMTGKVKVGSDKEG